MPSLVIVIATWASGGNLPPLLALGGLLRASGHRVHVLSSDATREPALRDGFEPFAYRTAPQPVVSLVHFLYGPARSLMARSGEAWTTDLKELNATRARFGLSPAADGLAAWEVNEDLCRRWQRGQIGPVLDYTRMTSRGWSLRSAPRGQRRPRNESVAVEAVTDRSRPGRRRCLRSCVPPGPRPGKTGCSTIPSLVAQLAPDRHLSRAITSGAPRVPTE
jgi:hypothetical protein